MACCSHVHVSHESCTVEPELARPPPALRHPCHCCLLSTNSMGGFVVVTTDPTQPNPAPCGVSCVCCACDYVRVAASGSGFWLAGGSTLGRCRGSQINRCDRACADRAAVRTVAPSGTGPRQSHGASQSHKINQNGATSGFEMCFAIGSQHLWCGNSGKMCALTKYKNYYVSNPE